MRLKVSLKIHTTFVTLTAQAIVLSILVSIVCLKAKAAPFDPPIVVIVSATICEPCRLLTKNIKEAGSADRLLLEFEGGAVSVPIITLNKDVKYDQIILQGLGIPLNQTVPQLYIFVGQNLIFRSDNITNISSSGIKLLVAGVLNRVVTEHAAPPQDLSEILKDKYKGKPRVIFIGTGNGPKKNPVFVGYTIKTITDILTNFLNLSTNSIITLYGSGRVIMNDAVERNAPFNLMHIVRLGFLAPDASFSPDNLEKVYVANDADNVRNSLFVYSGHGATDGIETWGAQNKFTPNQLAEIQRKSAHTNNVIISGVCYGGIFAQEASCGFFGASPTSKASGCWENIDNKVKDYASNFFKVISNSRNSQTSFEEAHWKAILEGSPADNPYTTMDSLADKYYQDFPERLPNTIAVSKLIEMADPSSDGKKAVLKKLTESLKPEQALSFKEGLVQVGYLGFWGFARIRLDGEFYEAPIQFDEKNKAGIDKIFAEKTKRLYKRFNWPMRPKEDIFKGYTVNRNGLSPEQFITEKFEDSKTHQVVDGLVEAQAEFKEISESKPLLLQLAKRIIFENDMRENREPNLKQSYESVRQCEQQNLKDFLF